MQSVAVLFLFAASVLAQRTPIPEGLSKDCSDYLEDFQTSETIRACLRPIVQAANASSTDAAVTALCAPALDAACAESVLRPELSKFYAACSEEVGSNAQVKAIYDNFYVVGPYREAVCSTGDDGEYCAESIALLANDAESGISNLLKNAEDNLTTGTGRNTRPNPTTFATTGLPFLFLTPSAPEQVLCSTCGQRVMAAYTKFQTALPYGPGLTSSPLLAQQRPLWAAIEEKCSDLAVANAGSTPGGGDDDSTPILGGSISGAKKTIGMGAAFVGAVAAVVVGAAAAL